MGSFKPQKKLFNHKNRAWNETLQKLDEKRLDTLKAYNKALSLNQDSLWDEADKHTDGRLLTVRRKIFMPK